MKSIRYLNRCKKAIDMLLLGVFLLLVSLVATFCISYDLSEYIFGALFIAIFLLIYLIITFTPLPAADLLEINSEMINFIYTSKYGSTAHKESIDNFFVAEVKKDSFRYILNHKNGDRFILPRYVYDKGARFELFLHVNKIIVKRTKSF